VNIGPNYQMLQPSRVWCTQQWAAFHLGCIIWCLERTGY